MGEGGAQGAGFYESSQSQMHKVDYVIHSSLSYVEWDHDPHPKESQGCNYVLRGQPPEPLMSRKLLCFHCLILSLQQEAQDKARWRNVAYTLSHTLTAKLICLFCVIRAPHTSC